ncbi:MAG: hypothetical protein KGM42_18135, partial [Hyphomicrobiales bacterium]|nr:hypothetical protein [Hyphomicrobiales bacterium]
PGGASPHGGSPRGATVGGGAAVHPADAGGKASPQKSMGGPKAATDEKDGGALGRPGSGKGEGADSGDRREREGKQSASPEKGAENGAHREGGGAISKDEASRVRTKMRDVRVREFDGANFHVGIGVIAPTVIERYWEPVPSVLLDIVPAWRAYRVVRVHGDILIVDPVTRRIVFVLQG